MKKKVTILALHLGYGGIEKYISSLCQMLEDNYEINIISTYKTTPKPAFKFSENIKIEYLIEDRPYKEEMIETFKFGQFKKAFKYFKINFYILRNKTKLDGNDYNVPILNNEIDKKYLDDFIKGINKVDLDILNRISEIKYDPDSVDERRLLLTMNDGNYVYVTMKKFDVLNNYVDFIREFDNKKGILYLNSGEYFKIFE